MLLKDFAKPKTCNFWTLKKKNLNSQTSVKNWKTYPRYLNFNLIKMNWILRRNIETLFITFLKDTFDKFGKKLKRRDEKNVFFLFSRLHAGLQSQLKESFRTADRVNGNLPSVVFFFFCNFTLLPFCVFHLSCFISSLFLINLNWNVRSATLISDIGPIQQSL